MPTVPGKTGAFFECGNVKALATAIENWFSAARSREEIRRDCYAEIDSAWTPEFQIEILKKGFSA